MVTREERLEREMYIINTYHSDLSLSWEELTCRYLEHFQIYRVDWDFEKECRIYVPAWKWDKWGNPDPWHTYTHHVRLVIGFHLQRVCRSQEKCPYKALLPEWESGEIE